MSAAELKRIGIMGGTFDPVHMGHMVCAEEAYRVFSLDVVFFIPTGNPSFKQGMVSASSADRLRMVELAIASNPYFVASRMEVDREGVTYTLDTLKELHRIYPNSELFFIAGADAISSISSWYGADELSRLATYVAARRPGYMLKTEEWEVSEHDLDEQDIDKQATAAPYTPGQEPVGQDSSRHGSDGNHSAFHIEYLDVPQIGVSSTMLRNRVAAGKSVRYLIPGPAYTYLMNKGLYLPDSKGDVRI